MTDYYPFKIFTSTGMILAECKTMDEAIAKSNSMQCSWKEAPGKQVGQWI